MTINDRLKQLLQDFRISPSEFSQTVGINRSAVTHLLSGRNKPSVDVLEKILNAYPDWNIHWLITGEGLPIRSDTPDPSLHKQDLFTSKSAPKYPTPTKPKTDTLKSSIDAYESTFSTPRKSEPSKIIMLNSDGTYSMYKLLSVEE